MSDSVTPWTVARQLLYPWDSPKARILERLAIPFSRGSSQPRDQTWVSCIASEFLNIWATKEMQDRSIKRIIKNYSWGNRWGDSGNSVKLYFLGSKITDGDCSHEIKRGLFLGRKVMTNLDSIVKSRDITLPAKGCSARSPSPRSGKKTPRNNATYNRGIYYWLEPGPPALTKGVRTKGPEPQFSPVFIGYNY